jgi:NAD(P)-dependent dehydrogenase (short-subunit alcohol dehydrogenase family)
LYGSICFSTKGALAALTRGLARDLGPRGITVNVVQPGPTETDMNASEEIRAMVRRLMALGRMGKDTENCESRCLSGRTGGELHHRLGRHYRLRLSGLRGPARFWRNARQ